MMDPTTVWAPDAKRVELIAMGKRFEMKRDEHGLWRLEEPRLLPGTDYAFSIDGSDPLPDPRSRFQPQGVHGPSRLMAPEFDWTDRDFRAPPLASAVIYELHVGTFSADGTFDGVIDRLPHLVALGVTHVELMPVVEFPGKHGWGYDGVALYAPHSAYGGPPGLKRLVDACHAHGLAVVLDVVYNHLGPDGNYLPRFGPYLTEGHKTPWGAAMNLDGPCSDGVRRFLIDNALGWFRDFHVDALRLDAVHALYDLSARHFLRELAQEVADLAAVLGKPLALVAESDLNDPRLIRAPEAGGYGLDGVWSDDFHHALHTVLTGERHTYYSDYGSLAQLAKALNRGFVYDGQYSPFRKRNYGEPIDPEISLRKLVVCMQNHDQIGNRAHGERIGHLIPARRVRLGATLVLLGPSVPLLFQGEEWNASAPFQYFTDHQDPELARAVREGRRREFSMVDSETVPDPQAPTTFTASKLDFDEIDRAEHAAMLEFYRTLIRLRRQRPELSTARVEAIADEASRTLLVRREESVIAMNFGDAEARVALEGDGSRQAELVLATEGASLQSGGIALPPDALAVISFRKP